MVSPISNSESTNFLSSAVFEPAVHKGAFTNCVGKLFGIIGPPTYHQLTFVSELVFLMKIDYDLFFNVQNEKKTVLDQYEVCFIFQLLKLRKIRGIKFVKQIGENI